MGQLERVFAMRWSWISSCFGDFISTSRQQQSHMCIAATSPEAVDGSRRKKKCSNKFDEKRIKHKKERWKMTFRPDSLLSRRAESVKSCTLKGSNGFAETFLLVSYYWFFYCLSCWRRRVLLCCSLNGDLKRLRKNLSWMKNRSLCDVVNFSRRRRKLFLGSFSCVLFLIAMNPRTSSAMLKSRSAPEWSSTKKKLNIKWNRNKQTMQKVVKKYPPLFCYDKDDECGGKKYIKIKCGMRICALKSSINTAARREELAGIRNGRRWCSPHKKREKQRILARKTNSLIMDDKSVVVVDWGKLKIIFHPLLLQHWN